MKNEGFLFFFWSIFFVAPAAAQGRPLLEEIRTGEGRLRAVAGEGGTLKSFSPAFRDGQVSVPMRKDRFAGPAFPGVKLRRAGPGLFQGRKGGVLYSLRYRPKAGGLLITAVLENKGKETFSPLSAGLRLGIDTWMDRFPRWNAQFFPTFFRCERTHFLGYFMTPEGRILGVTSTDPVASYTIEYDQRMYSHYIHTVTLDLLHARPLPPHHPDLSSLAPGERRAWRILLAPIDRFEEIPAVLSRRCDAPFVVLDRYTLEPGRAVGITVHSPRPVTVEVRTPGGETRSLRAVPAGKERFTARFSGTAAGGYYLVTAKGGAGRSAGARFFVRPPWSWYLLQARKEALARTPRADTSSIDGYSCESFYGLFGFFLARKYFPSKELDEKGDRILEIVLERLYKREEGFLFSGNKERIQNTSAMLSMLVDRYQATGDRESLDLAEKAAAFLLSRQREDGAYGGYGFKPYTSVIYPAKSLMELMEVEETLARKAPGWAKLRRAHFESVRRAMDELVRRGRNICTEGGATFEDGAITCSAAQLALFALLQEDDASKRKYREAAERLMESHRCLSRLHDPDTRARGATMRFWEAWGDIHLPRNMMLSPHGWSAWKTYGLYYLYLLTGKARWLEEAMDSLGSGVQLMAWPEGRLRYAFVPDPYVPARVREKDPKNVLGRLVPRILGECWLQGVGDWYGGRGKTWRDRVDWKWMGDGTAFEVFKAMEEVALTRGFVIEDRDGRIRTWNCRVLERGEGRLRLAPAEAVVTGIHLNLAHPYTVEVQFAGKGIARRKCPPGMQWIGAGRSR